VTVKKSRPYRPRTNGNVERFHRTLADEWAYTKPYTSPRPAVGAARGHVGPADSLREPGLAQRSR
jgi:transposase InsO family protein